MSRPPSVGNLGFPRGAKTLPLFYILPATSRSSAWLAVKAMKNVCVTVDEGQAGRLHLPPPKHIPRSGEHPVHFSLRMARIPGLDREIGIEGQLLDLSTVYGTL